MLFYVDMVALGLHGIIIPIWMFLALRLSGQGIRVIYICLELYIVVSYIMQESPWKSEKDIGFPLSSRKSFKHILFFMALVVVYYVSIDFSYLSWTIVFNLFRLITWTKL